jgi:hypothetical protein
MPLVELDQLAAADLVVALAGCRSAGALRSAVPVVRGGVALLSPALRVLVVHPRDGAAELFPDDLHTDAALTLFAYPMAVLDRVPALTPGGPDAYRALFAIAQRVGARAAVMLGSEAGALTARLVHDLTQPVLNADFDIVAPRYARRKFDGLINRSVVYPLTRALYGKRIQGQIGLDFGFSARVVEKAQRADGGAGRGARPLWIIPQAVSEDLTVCQTNLNIRLPRVTEPGDVRSALAQVLGSLFLDLERHAPFWQKVLRSQPVPTFGEAVSVVDESSPFDAGPLIESFRLAYRNLQDVWGLVLPPATLIELKRLTLQSAAQFRVPDDLWARIVYDFALGHRLHALSRDHLLGALTPAYLAWVASYAIEIGDAPPAAVSERLERLCLAYEAEKPYLLRRWRWPDRFNP